MRRVAFWSSVAIILAAATFVIGSLFWPYMGLATGIPLLLLMIWSAGWLLTGIVLYLLPTEQSR